MLKGRLYDNTSVTIRQSPYRPQDELKDVLNRQNKMTDLNVFNSSYKAL